MSVKIIIPILRNTNSYDMKCTVQILSIALVTLMMSIHTTASYGQDINDCRQSSNISSADTTQILKNLDEKNDEIRRDLLAHARNVREQAAYVRYRIICKAIEVENLAKRTTDRQKKKELMKSAKRIRKVANTRFRELNRAARHVEKLSKRIERQLLRLDIIE